MPGQLQKAVSRVDGPLKVTGQALYAGEFGTADLLVGHVLGSRIAKGRIRRIDADAARRLPGVLDVLTHQNRPPMAADDEAYADQDSPPGRPFRPLYDEHILFSMQPVALVVAEDLETARYAATLIQIDYEPEAHQVSLSEGRARAHVAPTQLPPDRGDADSAWAAAPVRIEAEYQLAAEFHNPMEMHASTAIYHSDGKLTVHDKTQGAINSAQYISRVFGLADGGARVVSPFVGGAFGSGLRPQYQLTLATMAALHLKRSVRVVLTRQQMFSFGHRPETHQHLKLACDAEGRLQSIIHEVLGETSRFEDFGRRLVHWAASLYECRTLRTGYTLVPLDLYTPIDMRAPGGAEGMYALESALDELAYAAEIDPLELRRRNFTDVEPSTGKPYSSKALLECYAQGAAHFGWSRRRHPPRSMREDGQLIGWGMAGGIWPAMQSAASAKAVIGADGRLTVASATADIGTGTYTVMSQIAAECLGLPLDKVNFQLGDSSLPEAPLEGGSQTVSTVGSAVKLACEQLKRRLLDLAGQDGQSPLAGLRLDQVIFEDGRIQAAKTPERRVDIAELLAQAGLPELAVSAEAGPSKRRKDYACYAHSAVFVEVGVDEALGTVEVRRMVCAVAAGRVLSLKAGRNQVLGGMVWGIGMALQEAGLLDQTLGRWMNHNLAEYHFPVNADVHELEVIFVEEHDDIVNPLGAKGIGEIGIVGVAAAIANAIHHATGKRVRDLPITLDKVMH